MIRKPFRVAARLLVCLTWALGALTANSQTERLQATTDGFVNSGERVRIHYLEAGPTTAHERAILFVPGWTMPAWIWEKQIAYFSRTHRVVAMDPRAQGKSTPATDGLYPAARARDIKAVVDELKLAPVVLVGWSMGVTEAAAYVDQFGTETLAALVLVDGTAGTDMSPEMSKGFLSLLMSLQKDRAKTTDSFVRFMYRTPQTEEYLKRVTETALVTPTNSAVTLGVSGLWTDNRPALNKIDKPTLIVVAASVPWGPVYEDMHKRVASSRLEMMENAGHALFVDQADRFNSLLEDFLKTLTHPSTR